MKQIRHLAPNNLREQLRQMRSYTAEHEQMMACFTSCNTGVDSVTVRLYEPERQDGSDLMPHLSMRLLMLPCSGKSMMRARHVHLLRVMLQRYGRVAVEFRPLVKCG